MESNRFDQIASSFASTRDRRSVIRALAASALGVAGLSIFAQSDIAAKKKGGKGKGKGKSKGGSSGNSGSSGGGNNGGGGGGNTNPPPRDQCPVSAKTNAPICGSEPGGLTCDCHRAKEGNNFCGGFIESCAMLQPCNSTQDCRDTVGFHFFCQAADGGGCGQVCVPECANINPF